MKLTKDKIYRVIHLVNPTGKVNLQVKGGSIAFFYSIDESINPTSLDELLIDENVKEPMVYKGEGDNLAYLGYRGDAEVIIKGLELEEV